MDLPHSLRIQAHANHLANRRLQLAIAQLTPEDWDAPRVNFFPSLSATLNHILGVDLYYIAALQGDEQADRQWTAYRDAASLEELVPRQSESDLRLIAFCDGLDALSCNAEVRMPRGGGRIQRDSAAAVLMHLFNHQVHHRGQVHAMLAGTAVKPPQLDEFMMPSESDLREADLAALGWIDAAIYVGR